MVASTPNEHILEHRLNDRRTFHCDRSHRTFEALSYPPKADGILHKAPTTSGPIAWLKRPLPRFKRPTVMLESATRYRQGTGVARERVGECM